MSGTGSESSELEHPREVLGVAQVVLDCCSATDFIIHGEVGAGAERRALAREDDGAKRRIPGGVSRQRRQRGDDFFVERIADFGPIECDAQDAVVIGAHRRGES